MKPLICPRCSCETITQTMVGRKWIYYRCDNCGHVWRELKE